MRFEGGSQFSGEGLSGGNLPAREDIQMEDCTLVLLAVNKRLGDAQAQLEDRIIDKQPGQGTTYDCKACFARLIDAGFANIIDAPACRSQWNIEASQAIAGK